jgi:hypothetical protein
MAYEEIAEMAKHDLAYTIRKQIRLLNTLIGHIEKFEVSVEITKGKDNKFFAKITEEI